MAVSIIMKALKKRPIPGHSVSNPDNTEHGGEHTDDDSIAGALWKEIVRHGCVNSPSCLLRLGGQDSTRIGEASTRKLARSGYTFYMRPGHGSTAQDVEITAGSIAQAGIVSIVKLTIIPGSCKADNEYPL